MNIRDHITALFFGAIYYWYADDQLAADTCLRAAMQIHSSMYTLSISHEA